MTSAMSPDVTSADRPKLVVIGNGMAGMRTVEELHKLAPDLYDITVFGAEPHGNYNRILLSPVLAGEKSIDDIMLNTREWYVQHGITLHAGDPVVHIDRRRRIVRAQSGLEVRYDRLLIATGSKPFIIPVPGHQLPGVLAFRDIQDVETMLAMARNHRNAVVIGGGLRVRIVVLHREHARAAVIDMEDGDLAALQQRANAGVGDDVFQRANGGPVVGLNITMHGVLLGCKLVDGCADRFGVQFQYGVHTAATAMGMTRLRSSTVAGRIWPRSSMNNTFSSALSLLTKVRKRLRVSGSSTASFHSQA